MANDLAVARLYEERSIPKRGRQRRQTQRGIKPLAGLHHLDRIVSLRNEQVREIISDVTDALWGHKLVDVSPFLRPHVAEQIGADRACRRLHLGAIMFVEPGPHVAVQLIVERLDLHPKPVHLA